jgi:hypothetical protein
LLSLPGVLLQEREVLDHMERLRPLAAELAHLINYVSLNMAGIRKSIKKFAKNVEPTPPMPGRPLLVLFPFVALIRGARLPYDLSKFVFFCCCIDDNSLLLD